MQKLIAFGTGLVLAGVAHAGVAFAQADDFAFDVDLELVLAVDVSRSMDLNEQRIQRDGYVQAFQHPDVLDAIMSGPLGRIAVTYVEWAGPGHIRTVAPWTAIGSPDEAASFAALLDSAPINRITGTSISGVLEYAEGLFGAAFSGYRQAIDVSGDGPNNAGTPVEASRDRLVARGVTINGLPIMLNKPAFFTAYGIPNLDVYYEDCVIGGPGAFVIPVKSSDDFAAAIRQKLILEIAGREPVVMQAAELAQAGPRVDCLIGEKSRRGWYIDR